MEMIPSWVSTYASLIKLIIIKEIVWLDQVSFPVSFILIGVLFVVGSVQLLADDSCFLI